MRIAPLGASIDQSIFLIVIGMVILYTDRKLFLALLSASLFFVGIHVFPGFQLGGLSLTLLISGICTTLFVILKLAFLEIIDDFLRPQLYKIQYLWDELTNLVNDYNWKYGRLESAVNFDQYVQGSKKGIQDLAVDSALNGTCSPDIITFGLCAAAANLLWGAWKVMTQNAGKSSSQIEHEGKIRSKASEIAAVEIEINNIKSHGRKKLLFLFLFLTAISGLLHAYLTGRLFA